MLDKLAKDWTSLIGLTKESRRKSYDSLFHI